MQASKRIGPGTKLRHLEVCEFYVQGAIQAKLLSLAKVKGAVNCANFLTKHPKSGTEVRAALPSLGMYEEKQEGEMLSEAQRINVKVGKVGTNKWKPPIPARPDETNLRGVVAGISAQESKPSSVDAGKTAQVSRHTTYRVGTTVRSVFAASQLLGTAASQKDILKQITSEWITTMIFLVLSMFALLGIYVTIREWIGLILEFCQRRRRREVIRQPSPEENRIRIQLPTVRPRNVIYTHPHYPNVHFRSDCPVFRGEEVGPRWTETLVCHMHRSSVEICILCCSFTSRTMDPQDSRMEHERTTETRATGLHLGNSTAKILDLEGF